MTGKRMINMDANMANFFTEMASSTKTLTVIFSDHGHKMTPFSYTEEGTRKLFDPVFFMIVPDGVKEKYDIRVYRIEYVFSLISIVFSIILFRKW